MKKYLFVIPSFHYGGTVSSLKNILPWLKEQGHVVDVFAITNSGPNYDQIAKYANILGTRLESDGNTKGIKTSLKTNLHKFLFQCIKRTKKQLCKIGIDISNIAFKTIVKKLQEGKYDAVIAFQEGQPTRFVSLFRNVRRIAWVRCDYGNMLKIYKGKPQHNVYSNIDQIVCVSEYTKEVFTKLLPETKDKIIALHNLIDTERIKKGAAENVQLDKRFAFNGFRIVSLGRLDPVKQFSLIPGIAKQLVDKGCRFKWFILGGKTDDNEYCLLLNNIQRFNVADCVLLLGEKNNPYPYIHLSDLVVCTSLSEACPNVINEAKILHTPVVSTNFGSAKEFITNGIDGFIEPIETIGEKIEIMIKEKVEYDRIKNTILCFDYDNKEIINMITNVLLIKN